MVGTVYTELTGVTMGLLSNPDTTFGTVLFFNVWVSFGINVLMFSNAMGNIDESVVESAQLDGVNLIQEFFHITIPSVWPTVVSCTIITVAGIFTNQMYLYDLFGDGGKFEIASIGYFLYQKASIADMVKTPTEPSMGILSALGLIFTLILVPSSMILKKLLTRLGPSVD
jgi:ABC-type sugar transport system permease subunit